MATIKRTISSFSVYSGYDQGDKWQTNYLAYSNSFVIPNENLISVSISVTFTGIDSSDNELSSAVSIVNRFLFIESSQVGSGNYYSGNSSSQLSNWIDNKGKTVCLEWLHRDMISELEGLDVNVFNYIISGYVQFATSSGQITKIYLGNNALPVCYLGASRIERIYLGTNLILNAGTKTHHSSTFSGTFNSKGIYNVSKNLIIGNISFSSLTNLVHLNTSDTFIRTSRKYSCLSFSICILYSGPILSSCSSSVIVLII